MADAQEAEAEGLRWLRQLAPAYRARPSLASPLLGAAGRSLGALAAVLPRPYGDALMGASYGCGIVGYLGALPLARLGGCLGLVAGLLGCSGDALMGEYLGGVPHD